MYLGYVISAAGVATDPGKIQAVAEWRRLQNLTELKSFLGFASFYRRFVKNFAKLAAPLHALSLQLSGKPGKRPASGQGFVQSWDATCEEAFVALKQKLISAPVLGYAGADALSRQYAEPQDAAKTHNFQDTRNILSKLHQVISCQETSVWPKHVSVLEFSKLS